MPHRDITSRFDKMPDGELIQVAMWNYRLSDLRSDNPRSRYHRIYMKAWGECFKRGIDLMPYIKKEVII